MTHNPASQFKTRREPRRHRAVSRIDVPETFPPEALPRFPGAEVVICRGAEDCPIRFGRACDACLRVTASDYDASAERPAPSA
jgi:hypothetical protein